MPSFKKPWRKLWLPEKLARSFHVAGVEGGLAFTLHLSPALQQTLRDHTDPARHMSGRINRELKRQFGKPLPYSFAFEVSGSDRLHLHGVIVPIALDIENARAIDRALTRAGGKICAAQIVQNTRDRVETLRDGLGWFGYLQKSHEQTASILQNKDTSFVSRSLGQLCRRAEKSQRLH